MVVDSKNVEFGYELVAALPYAYWHHLKGALTGTISGPDSAPFYWFSPDHQINPANRDWHNTNEAAKDIPNMMIHKPRLDKSQWAPPPLKEKYAPEAIKFSKPTVVIYNRYNKEWNRPPINYFDLATLRTLFTMLRKDYQIVYFNVRGQDDLEDNAHSMDLGDYDMIANEFKDVIVIHDLVAQHKMTYNEVQLRVFAGCERFITMNGGPSILASYFGGENIIYSRECRELWPTVNSFYNWYPDFGGSIIKVVNHYDDLIEIVRQKWVKKYPLINILVRCHRRKDGLERLHNSLQAQSYRNWNVIASYDDEITWSMLCKYPFQKLAVERRHPSGDKPEGEDYKSFLGPNLYLNDMAGLVKYGYVMYLDDDDYLSPNALSQIASGLDPYKLLLWNAVTENGREIPSEPNKGKIVAGDISGIAFAFHHKHLNLVKWEPWRRGDYRVISALASKMKVIYMDKSLSIIGKTVPYGATKEYIEMKKAEHKMMVDAINARVAAKLAEKKNAR